MRCCRSPRARLGIGMVGSASESDSIWTGGTGVAPGPARGAWRQVAGRGWIGHGNILTQISDVTCAKRRPFSAASTAAGRV